MFWQSVLMFLLKLYAALFGRTPKSDQYKWEENGEIEDLAKNELKQVNRSHYGTI